MQSLLTWRHEDKFTGGGITYPSSKCSDRRRSHNASPIEIFFDLAKSGNVSPSNSGWFGE